jgi:hypothetical protein
MAGSQLAVAGAVYCPPPPTHTQTLCVWGGGGEGVDYDELQRNMANSGFLGIKRLKTTWIIRIHLAKDFCKLNLEGKNAYVTYKVC